jgi:hypothetical protein
MMANASIVLKAANGMVQIVQKLKKWLFNPMSLLKKFVVKIKFGMEMNV